MADRRRKERKPIRERFAAFREAKKFAEAIPEVTAFRQGWRKKWDGPYSGKWWLAVDEDENVLATISNYGAGQFPWHVDEEAGVRD